MRKILFFLLIMFSFIIIGCQEQPNDKCDYCNGENQTKISELETIKANLEKKISELESEISK